MSGPKCGEWSVQFNPERERRIEAELRERERRIGAELRISIDSIRQALNALHAKWIAAAKKYGSEFPGPPSQDFGRVSDNADNETLRRVLEKLRSDFTSLESELADAESVHRIGDLLSKASAFKKAPKVSDSRRQYRNADTTEMQKAKLSATLSLLDPGAAGDERRAIELLSEEALAKPNVSKFESTLLELRLGIQRANRNKKERDRVAAKVEQLLDQLIGLEGQDVSRLKHELVLAREGVSKLRSGIDAEVASAAAAAAAEEDRRYASKVLIEELEKLGYSAEDGMQTVLVKGGELQINNADLKEYAVCFAVDNQREQFDVHLTRSSDAVDSFSGERRLRDRSMEEKWCGDLASALSSAAERGVVTRITKGEKPGVVPVVVRHGAERRRSAAAPRARSMQFPGVE